ncbi:MAG: MarR family transcriptional regulator [Ruminococcaceae bacterium]|nr:MarR family transcriptional regulator [Oscillospiraceae bacterium]
MEKKPLMLTLKHTDRAWGGYMRKIAMEAGIPDSYRTVIMFLARHGEASQKELAQFSHTTYAAISRTVKEMELTGYINKETDDNDRRYAKLSLTHKGIECDNRIREKIQHAEKVISDALDDSEKEMFNRTLQKINDIIAKQL